jgi:hypothetical protein
LRHHSPEYGAFVRAWFETDFDNGTQLQTLDRASDAGVAPPHVLAEAVHVASLAELLTRHEQRLKALDGKTANGTQLLTGGFAERMSAGYAAVRAEWQRKGWIRHTADAELDRVTLKGAVRLAQSSMKMQAAKLSGPALLRSSQAASATDRVVRADADFVAAWHVAKVPRSAPGVNWPLIIYCTSLLVMLLGVLAAVLDVVVAAVMLTALVAHEAAHVWALGNRRATHGLLFFLPFTGLIKPKPSDELGLADRVSVVLAGPMAGLMTGVFLLWVNCRWPNHYLPAVAAAFIGWNALLLTPFFATDGARILSAITAPGSFFRPMAQLVSVVALLAIGLQSKSQVLDAWGFLLTVWFFAQMPSFYLIRKIVRQIPVDANWDGAVHAALLAMTGPKFERWSSSIRQARAMSIANELTRPSASRRERALAIIAYSCCAVLAMCAALQSPV